MLLVYSQKKTNTCYYTSLEALQKSQKKSSWKTIMDASSRVTQQKQYKWFKLFSQPPELWVFVCKTSTIWLFWVITNHLRAFSGGSLAHGDMGKRFWWIAQLRREQSMTHQGLKGHWGLRYCFLTNLGCSNKCRKQGCKCVVSVLKYMGCNRALFDVLYLNPLGQIGLLWGVKRK